MFKQQEKLGIKDVVAWSVGFALFIIWALLGAGLLMEFVETKFVQMLFPALLVGWVVLYFGFVALVVWVRRLLRKQ